MLHDLIGVNQEELDHFFEYVEDYLTRTSGIWRHTKRFGLDLTSLKVDKYFDELFKEYIQSRNLNTGAFVGKSIHDLLINHASNKYVLATDIRRYFASIKFEHIESAIAENPKLADYSPHIGKLYFHENSLRKGLVASSAISEVVGEKIDKLVARVQYENGLGTLNYSRYYDDIIITGDSLKQLKDLLEILSRDIKNRLELELNIKKTKVKLLQGSTLLGLVFDKGELTVPKNFKNRLRSAEHIYDQLPEEFLSEVYDKLRSTGTIIASLHRIIDNSPAAVTGKYNESLNYYYDELERLQELRDQYIEDAYRNDTG